MSFVLYRRNPTWLFILSLTINLGMWFERFVIVIPSLSHEYEPWQWGTYRPTWVDYSILLFLGDNGADCVSGNMAGRSQSLYSR